MSTTTKKKTPAKKVETKPTVKIDPTQDVVLKVNPPIEPSTLVTVIQKGDFVEMLIESNGFQVGEQVKVSKVYEDVVTLTKEVNFGSYTEKLGLVTKSSNVKKVGE